MSPLIVRKSRWRNVVPLVGSWTVLGISLYYISNHEQTWLPFVVAMFFGSLALACSIQMLESKPCLIISIKGINIEYLRIGALSWNDLSGAFIMRDGRVDRICFTLRNPEEFRVRIGRLRRLFNSANQQPGYGDFTLNASEMRLDAKVVLELVRDQIDHAKDKPKGTPLSYDIPL